jgi:hypothetical protein
LIVADELHALELLLDLFFYTYEAWFTAHHWALACFFCELVETNLVEAVLALFALPGINENCLAKGAKQFGFNLVAAYNIFRVHAE